MSKLLGCPLCGTKAHVTRLPWENGKTVYNVACGVEDDDSDTCGLVLFGGRETRKRMVEKWNQRAEAGEDSDD